MKVNDENPHPDPDPLVRGIDPRIRIRIHTKMSWIHNTEVGIGFRHLSVITHPAGEGDGEGEHCAPNVEFFFLYIFFAG